MGGATYDIQPATEEAPADGGRAVFKAVRDGSFTTENNTIKPKQNDSEICDDITHYLGSEFKEVPDIPATSIEDPVARKPRRDPNDKWRWVVLIATFTVMVFIDGVGLSFGLLRDEFTHTFDASQQKLSLIGSMFLAIPLLIGPIMSALVDRFGCRVLTITAGLVLSAACLLAAMSNSAAILFLTYSLIGGLAVGILYVTSAVSLSIWFDERRSLAVSVLSCSFGIGPLIFSPLMQYLLKNFDWSEVIFILAAVFLNVCVCGALMRNPQWLKKKNKKKKRQSVDSPKRLSNTGSLSLSSSSSGSNSSIPLKVIINMEQRAERNTNPASVPAETKPTESTDHESENGKEKEEHSNVTNENTIIHNKLPNKTIQVRNRCKKMLSDHHYLKKITLFRNTLVHRGAMTSIPKYRLRSTLRPDVYSNSNWSLNSEADKAMKWYLRIWLTPDIMFENTSAITNVGFILFNLSLFNLYAWSILPYFFIKSFMDSRLTDGGTSIICIISVANIIATVLCSWAREKPWMDVMVAYKTSLILCGISVAAYPFAITYYWAVVFTSIVYGITHTISYALSPEILMGLVPMDKFTTAYCIALLVQGFGYFLGPIFGGMLFDATHTWDSTFWIGGCGLILAGILAIFNKFSPTFDVDSL